MHTAKRQHLRAIFVRRDVADLLAVAAHGGRFRSDEAVGVYFHLYAAIAENALGDDGDEIDAIELARHDEGCGLVVRVRCGCADAGHKHLRSANDRAVPVAALIEETDRIATFLYRTFEQDQRIGAHQLAIDVAVAVARSQFAGTNSAQHRARIAAYRLVDDRRITHAAAPCFMRRAASRRCGSTGIL